MKTAPNTPEKWREELLASGWKEYLPSMWLNPNGGLWYGVEGAWKRMTEKRGKQSEKHYSRGAV